MERGRNYNVYLFNVGLYVYIWGYFWECVLFIVWIDYIWIVVINYIVLYGMKFLDYFG